MHFIQFQNISTVVSEM